MSNFFIWCSGADLNTVRKCSSAEINKYKNIGMVVFFVALLASLSASYFVAFAFDKSNSPTLTLGYIAVGLLWGFIILSLDRSIVATISKDDSWTNQLIKASPRFLIAIFIGLVISTPLEMKIFEKEINEKLKVLIYDDKVSGIKKLVDEKKNLYKDNLKQKDDLTKDKDFKYDQFQKELKGSVTGQIGYGKKSREYELAYLKLDSLLSLKTTAIDTIQHEINHLNSSIGTVLTISDQDIAKYAGVEKRVQALYSLNSFHWVITCLFILFEILPMIVKLLAPKGDYDAYLRLEKESFHLSIIEDFNSQANLSRSRREIEQEKILSQEAIRSKIETELKTEILRNLSEAQNEIARARIEAFREKSLQSLHAANREANDTGSGRSVPKNIENTMSQQAESVQVKDEGLTPKLNPNSKDIVNSELEEIIWKGEFVAAMNVEFVFHSDPKKSSKKLFFKSGSKIKSSTSWCYVEKFPNRIEIMDNGLSVKYDFALRNNKLYLSDIKTKNEYEFCCFER